MEQGRDRGAVIASVFLAGRPRTKGHMIVRGKGAHDRPLLTRWMRIMGRQLQTELGITLGRRGGRPARLDAEPYAEPVEVHCFFRFDREESQREAALAGELKPSYATPWPVTIGIGDEDTLRRAVLDALVKNGVIRDDSLSIGGMNYKRWCDPGEVAGVQLYVLAVRSGSGMDESVRSWERVLGEEP